MKAQSFGLVATLAGLLLVSTQFAEAGRSSSLLDISADGKLLACSNRDSGTVTIVDLATSPPRVVRSGAISEHELSEVAGIRVQ